MVRSGGGGEHDTSMCVDIEHASSPMRWRTFVWALLAAIVSAVPVQADTNESSHPMALVVFTPLSVLVGVPGIVLAGITGANLRTWPRKSNVIAPSYVVGMANLVVGGIGVGVSRDQGRSFLAWGICHLALGVIDIVLGVVDGSQRLRAARSRVAIVPIVNMASRDSLAFGFALRTESH
jgi:hypothetical protein